MTKIDFIVMDLDTKGSVAVLLTVDAATAIGLLTEGLAAEQESFHAALHARISEAVASGQGGNGQRRHDEVLGGRHNLAVKDRLLTVV